MNAKRRTLNELRQTKDSHYVNPKMTVTHDNFSVLEAYLKYMREEQRASQISLKNFMHYMERNELHIVKG